VTDDLPLCHWILLLLGVCHFNLLDNAILTPSPSSSRLLTAQGIDGSREQDSRARSDAYCPRPSPRSPTDCQSKFLAAGHGRSAEDGLVSQDMNSQKHVRPVFPPHTRDALPASLRSHALEAALPARMSAVAPRLDTRWVRVSAGQTRTSRNPENHTYSRRDAGLRAACRRQPLMTAARVCRVDPAAPAGNAI
jgi:hypothetical protein